MGVTPEQIVVLARDCNAVRVPTGERVLLQEGTQVRITQAMGGSYTVLVDGNLARIDGEDADALGFETVPAPALGDGATDEDVEKGVWDQLRTCYDPEIPINVVDLGLVYACRVLRLDNGSRRVEIEMTLTAPACGMGPVLVEDVKHTVERVPGVASARVDLVFDPPWGPDRMSDAARLLTGML